MQKMWGNLIDKLLDQIIGLFYMYFICIILSGTLNFI